MIGVFGGEVEELQKTVDDAKEKRNALQRTADVAFKTAAIGVLEGNSKVLEDFGEIFNAVMIPELKDIRAELIKNQEAQRKRRPRESLPRAKGLAANRKF